MPTSGSSTEASATTFASSSTPASPVAPDDFWVEWHPTRSPLLDVDEDEWVRIANGVREMDCVHGYERDVSRVETGTAIVVFDDRDRSLDPSNPYAPNVGGFTPLRHVRIRATAGATTYTIWRGFTVDWRPDWAIDDAWVVLEAKDSLIAAAKKLRENTLSAAIAALAPDIWLPLDDGGTVFAQARDTDTQHAVMTATSATGSILPFATQPSTTFPHVGESRGDVVTTIVSYQVDPAGFSVIAVIKAERDQPQVILAAGPEPAPALLSGDVGLTVDAGDTYSLRVGNPSGNSLLSFPRPHADPSTLVFGCYDPTETTLWASKAYGHIGGATYPNSGLGGTWAPRAGKVRVGAGLDAPNGFPFLGSLCHVALWQRVLSPAEARTIYSGYWGIVGPNADVLGPQYAHHVIGWVLDQLGIPGSRRDLATGTVALGGIYNDLVAVDMMSRAAATERGWFFADREGTYCFRLATDVGDDLGTYDTRPAASGGANAALAGLRFAHDDRTFFTVARMLVSTASQPQVVEYRHANADSSTGYGEVIFDAPTQFETRADALAAAIAIVGDATPRLAVVEAEVAMGAAGVDPAKLLASDILDQVSTVARIPGKVGPVPALLPHTQTATVVKVRHTFGRDGAWRTRWSLLPS